MQKGLQSRKFEGKEPISDLPRAIFTEDEGSPLNNVRLIGLEGDESAPYVLVSERPKARDPLGSGPPEATSLQGRGRRRRRSAGNSIQRFQIRVRILPRILEPHFERR